MSEITSEELGELDKEACEVYKMQRIIDYIKDPAYTVMWIGDNGYRPLDDKTYRTDFDELKVYFKDTGHSGEYLDLWNATSDEFKIYEEIKLR